MIIRYLPVVLKQSFEKRIICQHLSACGGDHSRLSTLVRRGGAGPFGLPAPKQMIRKENNVNRNKNHFLPEPLLFPYF